jgi:hypothetical protein
MFIIAIILFGVYILNGNYTKTGMNNTNNDNVSTIISINPIPSPSSVIIDYNNTLNIPPNDYVINHINWSLYPNLETGYVYLAEIQGPNDYINHKFIVVQILTEIKDTNDNALIDEQLIGVAHEARNIYGPNSGIHIISTKDGVAHLSVSMLPYNDTTY